MNPNGITSGQWALWRDITGNANLEQLHEMKAYIGERVKAKKQEKYDAANRAIKKHSL